MKIPMLQIGIFGKHFRMELCMKKYIALLVYQIYIGKDEDKYKN